MAYKYRSGVSDKTTKNLLIGPGAIFKGFQSPTQFGTLLGATSGGNTIKLETEWHVAAIDGVLGPLKGGRWLTSANAQLETNLIEMTKENFVMKYPSFRATKFDDDYTKIHHTGEIAPTMYQTIAVVGEISGKNKPIIFVLENAAAVDAVEVPLGNGTDDVVLQVQWDGHYDPAEPTRIPFYILYPDAETSDVEPPYVVYDEFVGPGLRNATANTIEAHWTKPVDPDYVGALVYVNNSLVTSVPETGETYTITGLNASTEYTVRIVAKYSTGSSAGVTVKLSTTA